MCGEEWADRDAFLADPTITVTGYSAHFKDLELGLFYFNHESCKTTMALLASLFTDLYDGPVLRRERRGPMNAPDTVCKIPKPGPALRNANAHM